MILMPFNDDTAVILEVTHVTSAEDAARELFYNAKQEATRLGGAVVYIDTEEGGGYGVKWLNGPERWAERFVKAPDAVPVEFSASVLYDNIVMFYDN